MVCGIRGAQVHFLRLVRGRAAEEGSAASDSTARGSRGAHGTRAYAAHSGAHESVCSTRRAGADLDDGCKVGLDVRLPLVEALPTLDDDEWREAPALVRADGSLQRSSTVAGCDGGLRCDARGRFSIETQPCVACTWRCCGVHGRSDDVVEQSRRIRHWRPWHQMGAHALWG